MKRKKNWPQEQTSLNLDRPDHISYSQISDYARCPFYWYVTRMTDVPMVVSDAMTKGIITHSVLDRYTKWYMGNGVHDTDMMVSLLDSAIQDCKDIRQPPSQGVYQACRVLLTNLIASKNLDLSNVLFSEHSFDIPFCNTHLVGRIDRVDELSPGVYRITDYKSGVSLLNDDSTIHDLELNIYAYALTQMPELGVQSIILCVHNIAYNIFSEVYADNDTIYNTMSYVKSIYERMEGDTQCLPNIGDSCNMYGGCHLSGICGSDVLKGVLVDESSPLTDEDHVKIITTVSALQGKIRKSLKERLESGEEIRVGDNSLYLSPRNSTKQNDHAIGQFLELFGKFGITPSSFMTLSKTKLAIVERKLRNMIESEEMSEPEKNDLLESLDILVEVMYNTYVSGYDIKVGKLDDFVKEEGNGDSN